MNRRNIVARPDKNVNASEDFLVTVVHAHINAAAMCLLGMDNLDDEPDINIFPPQCDHLDKSDKATMLQAAADLLVHQFVDLSYTPRKTQKKKNWLGSQARVC